VVPVDGDAVSLKGQLLVAVPGLYDPNFARTVVLLLEHTDEGAIGVVLNRPSDHPLGSSLPDWDPFAAEPSVVFVGGPVSEETAICLGRTRGSDDIGVVDANRDPADLAPDRVRFFAGYAGWEEGQLEAEIIEGSWIVVPAEPEDALVDAPEDLWASVLKRQGGVLALLANAPEDISTN
jgi:putative transcriptional regulator